LCCCTLFGDRSQRKRTSPAVVVHGVVICRSSAPQSYTRTNPVDVLPLPTPGWMGLNSVAAVEFHRDDTKEGTTKVVEAGAAMRIKERLITRRDKGCFHRVVIMFAIDAMVVVVVVVVDVQGNRKCTV
jgi:hypothetical protein